MYRLPLASTASPAGSVQLARGWPGLPVTGVAGRAVAGEADDVSASGAPRPRGCCTVSAMNTSPAASTATACGVVELGLGRGPPRMSRGPRCPVPANRWMRPVRRDLADHVVAAVGDVRCCPRRPPRCRPAGTAWRSPAPRRRSRRRPPGSRRRRGVAAVQSDSTLSPVFETYTWPWNAEIPSGRTRLPPLPAGKLYGRLVSVAAAASAGWAAGGAAALRLTPSPPPCPSRPAPAPPRRPARCAAVPCPIPVACPVQEYPSPSPVRLFPTIRYGVACSRRRCARPGSPGCLRPRAVPSGDAYRSPR